MVHKKKFRIEKEQQDKKNVTSETLYSLEDEWIEVLTNNIVSNESKILKEWNLGIINTTFTWKKITKNVTITEE